MRYYIVLFIFFNIIFKCLAVYIVIWAESGVLGEYKTHYGGSLQP